jgi:hypothetical protein
LSATGPTSCDHGVRWISRTPDQDALGMVLPATAEPEGYTAEKAKGNVKTLAAGAAWRCDREMGALTPDEGQALEACVQRILVD